MEGFLLLFLTAGGFFLAINLFSINEFTQFSDKQRFERGNAAAVHQEGNRTRLWSSGHEYKPELRQQRSTHQGFQAFQFEFIHSFPAVTLIIVIEMEKKPGDWH